MKNKKHLEIHYPEMIIANILLQSFFYAVIFLIYPIFMYVNKLNHLYDF